MLILNIDEICGSMVLFKKLTHTHGDGGGDGPNGSFCGVLKRAKYPRRPIFWVLFWQTMGVMLQIAAAFGFLMIFGSGAKSPIFGPKFSHGSGRTQTEPGPSTPLGGSGDSLGWSLVPNH